MNYIIMFRYKQKKPQNHEKKYITLCSFEVSEHLSSSLVVFFSCIMSAHPPPPSFLHLPPSCARAGCILVCSAARIAHAQCLSVRWWGKGALVKRNGGFRLFLTVQSHESRVGGGERGGKRNRPSCSLFLAKIARWRNLGELPASPDFTQCKLFTSSS